MPVLDGFAWIGQHGAPVLPARAFSFASNAAHAYNLVVTDADGTDSRGMGTVKKRGGVDNKESVIYQQWVNSLMTGEG